MLRGGMGGPVARKGKAVWPAVLVGTEDWETVGGSNKNEGKGTEEGAGGSSGEGIFMWRGDTMTGGADIGGGVLTLVGEVSWWPESFKNSAANSWASLDFFPTLPKGLMTTPEDGREEAVSLSVFSLFRELDLWGALCPWPFRGTVTCWVGGMWPCTDAGLSPPFRRSNLDFRAEYESAWVGLCVKDCERFLRGLSSKNSMMKACWERCSEGASFGVSALGDEAREGLRDSGRSGATGEVGAGWGGENCCCGFWAWVGASDWSDWTDWCGFFLFPFRTGSSESLCVPSSWWWP